MMTSQQIESLIAQGEGYNLEFKQAIPSKLSELSTELCAFSNADGGILLVGIKDDGSVIGVELDNQIRSRIQDVVSNIEPRPEIIISEVPLNGRNILCFNCKSGQKKPYVVSGNIYVRNGPNAQKLTSISEIREFFQYSDSIFFDTSTNNQFQFPHDFDKIAFQQFLDSAKITSNISDEKILNNLKLTHSESFTNAAVLFFAKDVQKFVEQSVIRCLMFKGLDKRYIIDSKEIKGNLIQQFEEGMKYIISKLNLKYEIENQANGRRKEILEIPETVFREALINAICHRSYYEKGGVIAIEVYDDRIEITNPGGLISGISFKEFGHKSLSRNPLIFGLMQRINLVEKVGSGIIRMKDSMKEAGLEEPLFTLGGFFTVTFFRPINFEKLLEYLADKVSVTQKKILQEIYNLPSITTQSLANKIGLSIAGIEKSISTIKELGIIERKGSRKSGHWVINNIHQIKAN